MMNIDKTLLEKYFKGHCTADEQQRVEAYLLQPDHTVLDKYLQDTWDSSVAATPVVPMKQPRNYRYWYGVAAAIALLVSVGGWWWKNHTSNMLRPSSLVKMDTLFNHGNNIQRYTMPDGTIVWLNSHAVLTYREDYNRQNRDLWLTGEGYFEVAHDDTRPFRVHTGEVITTALGTAFNIATANRAGNAIEISLLSGKVAVSMATGPHAFTALLHPGQMLVYNKMHSPERLLFNKAEVLDWRSGKIVFEKTTLENALCRLQSRYGCTIDLGDTTLSNKKISGTFKADMSLEQILSTLKYVHGFTYKRIGENKYLIMKPNKTGIIQE
jgi:transmembrane sensor